MMRINMKALVTGVVGFNNFPTCNSPFFLHHLSGSVTMYIYIIK